MDLSNGSGSGLFPKTGSDFEPIIADAVVSSVGSEEYVLINLLLHDTGAQHSFIVES